MDNWPSGYLKVAWDHCPADALPRFILRTAVKFMMFRTYRHPGYARETVATVSVIAGAFLLLAGLAVAVWGGYAEGWSWTGLPEQRVPKNPNEEYVRGKTLWDWLSLLIVPLFIAVGGFLLNRAMKERENRLAADRQRQALLDKYFDVVSDTVATVAAPSAGGAPLPEADLVTATIIRARTLTTLQELDGHRKGALIRFLLEA
jgi:hypothetical protein